MGCRFHLCPAWYRQVQKLGLQSQYTDESSAAGKWTRYCFGLPFLDPSTVEEGFSDLIERSFATIFLIPTFPQQRVFGQLSCKTNACESFRSIFNAFFYTAHLYIFTFIERLNKFQTDSKFSYSQHCEVNVR